jgi:prepilin signal peptidase PulO-like enzyme (type II secretory pathway)
MGKLKKITIREGIPFVPSFLMGFILTFFVIDKIVLLFL